MIRLAVLLGLVGLALATGLVVWSGYELVLSALARAGWGIVWTSLFHVVPMILCVIGWQALLGRGRPSLPFFLYVLWLRASVNNLMPVARVGGEIVSVRVMRKHGMRLGTAVASTVVETTLSVIAVFLFTLIGVALFMQRVTDEDAITQLLIAVLVSAPLIGALLVVQKIGFFALATRVFGVLFRDKWQRALGGAARLDRAVRTLYRRRGRVVFCGVMQLASWVAGSAEIWLAMYFLGHPVTVAEAVMIEALIQAASSAAFLVPGALGVQEAGFLLFGHLIGLTPDLAAALAVIRRCRDLILYVPGLAVWQIQEGRWFLRASRKGAERG